MTTLRVRHVADVNPSCPAWDRLPDDAELAFVPLEAVWPRRVDVSRRRLKSETATGYTRFQQGDVVVPKITPTFEADRSTWVESIPTFVATGTTELHVVRARPGTEPRYLDYLCSSSLFLQGGEAEMIGVAGQKRVPDTWLRDFPVPVADVAVQRSIADYLDAETARIDALISKKQKLAALVSDRLGDLIERRLFGTTDRTRLDRLTDPYRPIMYGIVLPGPDVDEGIAIVKGGNVRDHAIGGHVCHTTPEIAAPYGRSRLAAGDLVIIIRGAGAGRVAHVDDRHVGWNITQDVARVAPAAGVDDRWLRHVLEARPTQEQLRVRVGGAAITGINVWDLKRLEVPTAALADQRRIADEIDRAERQTIRLTDTLALQISRLAEHRQALITAAVTGELTVPGAV